MRNRKHFSHLIEINLAMLFISTSGALARYITLPVPAIIGLRALLALVLLVGYCQYKGISLSIDKKHVLAILTSGLLMGLHWMTYFYALKLSNVAIGMLSLFTYPILTAFLEPILLKTKLQKIHVLLGLLVLLGIYFLVPSFDLENKYTLAVVIGIFSAFCYALRNIILKTKVAAYNGSMLMCYQMAVVGFLFCPMLYNVTIESIYQQWESIAALAIITTALGHTLFLNSFTHFSITTVSILSSVQPIFGILIGAALLNEIPTLNTLIGGFLILSSVVIESIRSAKK